MTDRKILFITEGIKTERDALVKLLRFSYIGDYEFYGYGKDLSSLMKLIFEDSDSIDENIDLQMLLAENEDNPSIKKSLIEKYTDVFMVFDLDYQRRYSGEEIRKISLMLEYYSNSSETGKLYINYPMMESYLHIDSPLDEGFMERKISITECKTYKEIVNGFTYLKDPSKIRQNDFISIVKMNLSKGNRIISGNCTLPTKKQFHSWKGTDVFEKQLECIEKEDSMWVLNTSLYSVVSYNTEPFLEK